MHEPPGYARFEAPSGKAHADSLPSMPTWANAGSIRVADDPDRNNDVEMGDLAAQPAQMSGALHHTARMNRPSDGSNLAHGTSQYGLASASAHGGGPAAERSYGSDLGAQRLPAQNAGYSTYGPRPAVHDHYGQNAEYYGGGPSPGGVPQSPAPTYRTSPAQLPGGHEQHLSYNQTQGSLQHPSLSSPSGDMHHFPSVSTRYEPTAYSEQAAHSPSHGRPPILFHAGRKPVASSFREV